MLTSDRIIRTLIRQSDVRVEQEFRASQRTLQII
jgi:hypothetical protein